MIRVAFTLIGGQKWTGGYNYLLNLLRALAVHTSDRVHPVLFFGTDSDRNEVAPFECIDGISLVQSAVFNVEKKGVRLQQALITGRDREAMKIFSKYGVGIVFESAQFYGWRFPLPAVAWIPDFQHRYLKHFFNFSAYWKREIGFRIQIMSGRKIILSSEDAKKDCERFYPSTRGLTHVVRFVVPATDMCDADVARGVADSYRLPKSFFFLPNQFWKHKNHECVIHALKILKDDGKEVVVAASGMQIDPRDQLHFPKLQKLIELNGLETNFRLLGLIPSAHVHALMLSCAALINPSRFEGWSTTVEEAKATGTPMILSSLRVHQEQSKDAMFFDAASPQELARILANFPEGCINERVTKLIQCRQRVSEATKVFAEEFSSVLMSASKMK
jgi:glycosyltransferase involved in cell wall biosynthesis